MEINFDDLLLPGRTPTSDKHQPIIPSSSVVDSDDEEEHSNENNFDDSQMHSSPVKTTGTVDQERYEQLRRSAFSKNTLKKVINSLSGSGVGPVMLFVIGGFTKVYVGELTHEALELQKEQGLSGPITPETLAEAYRRYHKRNYRSTICNFFPKNSLNRRLLCKRM